MSVRDSLAAAILLLAFPAVAWPDPAPADPEMPVATGSITGEVRITSNLTAQKMRFRLYPGFRSVPAPGVGDARSDEWRNIVIYLDSPDLPAARSGSATEEYRVEQRGETFIPHVLPIVKGSTVEFPNQDPIFHNVFSLSGTKSFDLGRYPQGESRSVTFDEAGIVPVFCHIHSDMNAIIMVLENPFFAVPGPDGRYTIENVPPGTYTLVAWHERAGAVERQVEVRVGHALEVDVSVPIEYEESSGR